MSASYRIGAFRAEFQQIQSLVGDFTLLQVTTSDGSGRVSRTRLTLAATDSASRLHAIERSIGHMPRRDLQLVGTWQWSSGRPPIRIEMDAGTLYLGCRDCTDASPDHLSVTTITPQGFSGTWIDFQTGLGYAVDDEGRRLPDPAGYFCAVRRDDRHQ